MVSKSILERAAWFNPPLVKTLPVVDVIPVVEIIPVATAVVVTTPAVGLLVGAFVSNPSLKKFPWWR